MDRPRAFRRSVARNPAGKRELREEPLQARLILTDIGVDLAVSPFEIGTGHDGRTAMSRPRHVNHVRVVFLDDSIQVRVNEILTRRRAPVSEQHALDVGKRQRLLQQRVVAEIDLSDGQIVGGTPVGVHFPRRLRIEHQRRRLFRRCVRRCLLRRCLLHVRPPISIRIPAAGCSTPRSRTPRRCG